MSTFHLIGTRLCAALFILLFCSTAFGSATKVDICHVPPDDPESFHTIRINSKALPAHLAHGDLGEACNVVCAALCDDGNACTIDDDISDCEQNGCPVDREPVDCNDQNECTADSCDPTSGCINTPRLGEACDDGALCTGADTCDADGQCTGPAIDNCCLADEDCSGDLCDQAECNITTNRCGINPVVCSPEDLCSMSTCAPDTGGCVDSPIVCTEPGDVCNPASGECESVNICPCFDQDILDSLGPIATGQCGDDFPQPGLATAFYADGSIACSGLECSSAVIGCGYLDFTNNTEAMVPSITDEQDEACRALIVNNCPAASPTEDGPPVGQDLQYSLPLLSN